MNGREHELQRVLEQAPRTETGILLPQHVIDQVAREKEAALNPPPATPNRAQRRAAKKRKRR